MAQKHLLLAIAAVLLTLIISLPNLFLIWTSKNGSWPLTTNTKLAYMEEETYIYAAHVHQILNRYVGGDPYIWEYRDWPSPYMGELGSTTPVAILSRVTSSVPMGFLLSDFIFPAFLFLLIFLFLEKLGYEKNFSITAALSVITIPYLSMLLPKLSSFGTQLTGDETNAMFFSRTPHPQISSLYLFGSLFLTALILKNPTKRLIYLWAVVFGLSLYSSPFVSSTVFLASLLVSPILVRKLPKKTLVISLVIISLISLPYILNMLQLQNLLASSDFLLRTTFPVEFLFPRYLRYLVIAALLFKFRKDALSWTIIAYIAAAVLFVDGHQIVTGRNLEADHWITRVLAPISTLSLFLIVYQLTRNFRSRVRMTLFWQSIALVLILIAFYKQFTWVSTHINQLTNTSLKALTDTIEQKTQKSDVIGSLDPQISKHITGLTGRRVYLAPGDRTLAGAKEQIERICYLAILSGYNPNSQVERNVLNYALGFNVWSKDDVTDINSNIKECITKPAKVPKYRLDFLIEKDKSSGDWKLIPMGKE